MSGSSAGNYVSETPSASDEDRALDEAGRLAADQVVFTLTMLSLAAPSQKRALEELIGDVQLLALRERAARHAADQIAEKVVAKLLEHTQVVGAKLVQKPIPDGLPPLPWSFSSYAVRDAYERAILWDMDIEADVNKPLTCEAIIAAMNAYYSPQTPAESATSHRARHAWAGRKGGV